MKLLLVEDDEVAAGYLKRALSEVGHTIDHTAFGRHGLFLALRGPYDVIVLDRLLPELDGLTIVRTVRAAHVHTPVMLLTAMAGIDERVEGLHAGADDYLVKPFAMAEFVARISALARRPASQELSTVLQVGDLRMDLFTQRVSRAGAHIELQHREFQVLEYLVRHAGRVVTRSMLLENVWNFYFQPQSNIVESHIRHLRAKIDPVSSKKLIHTVRGSGYMVHDLA